MKTDDLRIVKTRPLLSPAILAEEIPLSDIASTRVYEARRAIEAILDGKDRRLLVVVGPCSVHDTKAALETQLGGRVSEDQARAVRTVGDVYKLVEDEVAKRA